MSFLDRLFSQTAVLAHAASHVGEDDPIPTATGTEPGLMSAADKVQLAALQAQLIAQQAQIDALLAGAGAGVPQPDSPYVSVPAAPSAWDLDAAELESADLAAAGWLVRRRGAPNDTLTRAGEILYGSPPTIGTYRSTLAGGKLLVQLPVNSGCTITKEVTDTSATYRARALSSHSGNHHFAWLLVGSGLDIAPGGDYIVTGIEWGTYVSNRILGASFVGYTATLPFGRFDVTNFIHYAAGGATISESFVSDSGIQGLAPYARTIAPITRAGIMLHCQSGEPNTIFMVDHIRQLPYLARF